MNELMKILSQARKEAAALNNQLLQERDYKTNTKIRKIEDVITAITKLQQHNSNESFESFVNFGAPQ